MYTSLEIDSGKVPQIIGLGSKFSMNSAKWPISLIPDSFLNKTVWESAFFINGAMIKSVSSPFLSLLTDGRTALSIARWNWLSFGKRYRQKGIPFDKSNLDNSLQE
ncbi:MAG: hypothetical protein ABIN48_03115 [Ginsengibacter sp.]